MKVEMDDLLKDDWATVTKLAEIHGVVVSAVSNWQKRYPSFPKPLFTIGGFKIFSIKQVEDWVANHRRSS